MKKVIFIAVSAVFMVACGSDSFTLDVLTDPIFNGAYAYLSYDGAQRDSVQVVEGKAHFTIKGLDGPRVARVLVRDEDQYANGTVVIETGTPTLEFVGESAVCSGSPQNELLNAYATTREGFYSDIRATYEKLRDKSLGEEERNRLTGILNEQYEVYVAKASRLDNEFFAANSDLAIGGIAMMRIARGREQFDSLYNIAGEAVRNYAPVVEEKKRYACLDATSEGKMFTDFTIEHGAADGSPVSLSDYVGRGKYVLVDFWASWCGPCRGEMPNLASVYEKYKGDDFELVGVAVWERKRADTEKALTQLPITWPIIFDAESIPTDIYGIDGIPQIILFGPDGTIVARDLRGEDIGRKIAECLGR